MPYATERAWVQDSIQNTWVKHSNLKVIGWKTCGSAEPGIHIGVADVNPHTDGLGNKLNGIPNGMVLNFTFNDWAAADCKPRKEYCIRTIAVHEFGHALGFTHEQNRRDTPKSLCSGQEQGTVGDIFLTPWDLDSVMNYCNPKWSGDGKLSRLDIEGLQTWYGKPNDPFSRYQGQWVAKLTYSDPSCVADDIRLTVAGRTVTGKVKTPFGLEIPIRARIDEQSNLIGLNFQFNKKDRVTLQGTITDGVVKSTDCGCGTYRFRR